MSSDEVNPNARQNEVSSALPVCQSCEADLRSATAVCDRCGWFDATLSVVNWNSTVADGEIERTTHAPSDIAAGSQFSFRLSTVLLMTTAVAVLLAIGLQAPGLAVVMGVFGIPPLVRTAMVVRRRASAGVDTDVMTRATLFAVSMMVTWVIVAVMIGSCCLTFCFTCLGVMATGANNEGWMFGIAGCVSLAVAIGFLWLFTPWIRKRWQRDTQVERTGDQS